MKKSFKVIFLSMLIIFMCIWLPPLIKCELLTLKHIDEFTDICSQEFESYGSLKVISYSENKTEIYALHTDKEYADTYFFVKNFSSDQWSCVGRDTVWAVYGNADKVLWPYWWHIIYSTGITPVIIVAFLISFAVLIKRAVKAGKRYEDNAENN